MRQKNLILINSKWESARLGRLVLILVFNIFFYLAPAQGRQTLLGHWEGGINRLGSIQVLRFDFHLLGDSLVGTFDDPASAVINAPFYALKSKNDTLTFNFGYGNFRCTYHADVNEITGVNNGWNPGLQLHMRKYGSKKEAQYDIEEITYLSGNYKMGATLLKPRKKQDIPAVVLIHGSGQVVRTDGYYFSLAHNLAEKGIAVLLYDKRGCGKSTGSYEQANFYDLADDAVAGVNYLKSRKDLPITKVGLLGTSQGGWVSYIAAKKSKNVQFIVSNVGASVSLFQQDLDRIKYTMEDNGIDEVVIDSALTYANKYFRLVEQKLKWKDFEKDVLKAQKSSFAEYVFVPSGNNDPDVLWWRNNHYDPKNDLSTLGCPMISILGANDILVNPNSNRQLMEDYLRHAGVEHRVVVFPNCGHSMESFSTLKGGDWNFPEKFWIWKKKVPEFYPTIVDWVTSLSNKQ